MEKHIYREENFNISKWSGGSTKELAIFPQVSKYLERDFIWRLSSATVDVEESAFTRLPDYDRILLVLEGEAVLAHGDERSVRLKEMEQDSFDGAVKTKCFGKIRDYNLMFRKGCCGRLEQIFAQSDAKPVTKTLRDGFSHASYGFYCTEGYIIVSIKNETVMLKPGEQLVMEFDTQEDEAISLMGDGRGIMAEVAYNMKDHASEEIPEEKATADDFKMAFKLVHTRHRWNQVLKSGKTNVWYDEILQKKLKLLEKSCITFIIWLLVAAVVGGVAAGNVSAGSVVVLLIAWTILHILFIAPLIYMLVLPKPIKAHIKDINDLTAYEQSLYEAQLTENHVADKILKRYEFSGRNEYLNDYESKLNRFKK